MHRETLLLLTVATLLGVPLAAEAPPNIVLVLTDDLGYGDTGPYGADLISTPNLDRMAAEGVTLTSFYASASVCTASRGGLLTGRYPIRLGLVDDVARPTNDIRLLPEEITLAEILHDQGYRSAAIGKWHLGHQAESWPTEQGFDYYYGLPYSNDMTPLALYRGREPIEDPVEQTTLSERYVAEAVRFIEENRDRPFFVYLAHSMPHVPLYVSERFRGRSKAGLYGDVVETIDWTMGQIFETLDRLELDERTIVLFTSDNGPWWEGSAGELRDRKGSSWEGGQRVPLIVRWPGSIPAGATTDAISMNIDLLPTLVNLAGGVLPDTEIDGRDILPLLQGGEASPHEYLLFFQKDRIAAVRSQRWKLVVESYYRSVRARIGAATYHHPPGLLFDLENDPTERYSFTREHMELALRMRGWIDGAYSKLVGGELEDLPVWAR